MTDAHSSTSQLHPRFWGKPLGNRDTVDTYVVCCSILGYSEYRVHFVLRALKSIAELATLKTVSTGSMSSTEGPNTSGNGSRNPSTSGTRSTNIRSTSRTQSFKSIAPVTTASTRSIYTRYMYTPEILPILSTTPRNKFAPNSHLLDHPPANAFCNKWR